LAGGHLGNNDVLSFFQGFGGKFGCKWVVKFLRSLNRAFTVSYLWKKVEIIEKADAHMHTTLILIAIQCEQSFSGMKFHNRLRNNIGKRYFKLISVRIPLKQLYYLLSISMVDSAISLINCHFIDISRS